MLGVIALIGWTRHPDDRPLETSASLLRPGSAGADEFGQPYGASVSYPSANAAQVIYGSSPLGPDDDSTYMTPPPAPAGVSAAVAVNPNAPAIVRPVVARRHYYTRRGRRRYVVVVRRRPFRRSAEIVGGSALGGALIGGLAGGGKGAAIGALVGGGGGYVYDRLTHKKRVVVRR
jgi:hypothetical protein